MMGLVQNSIHWGKHFTAVIRMCMLVVFVVCLTVAASATITNAPTDYLFDIWTTDNGLPQNSVNAILQTRDGYLWLATFDGLVRYDGVRFIVFNVHNTPGVTSNRFTSLLEDRSGDLWIGTDDAGVIRYHNGKFSGFKTEGQTEAVIGIQIDDSGNILVVTEHVRYRFDGNGLVRTKLTPDNSDADLSFIGRDIAFAVSGNRLLIIR